jgi:hypothetical protein
VSKHPIPAAALAHHIAVLGKTGSGKSNAVKVIVEEGLNAGERTCVIDPTGAWWGLRLRADGKPSKYPVVIFGGLHADVQIGGAHGQPVAEVVATSSTPAVIDTRLMTVGERTAFFTAFAQTLLRRNRGPLRLVVDEAHLFAPQTRVTDPRSGEMLHAANNLVSLGRSIGLRIVLISQRPAKLHKDSLTQVETLVAMRLIAPQDRDAVSDWIADQADKEQGKEIVASLPVLKTGDAWIWSPEAGVLERAHFPLATTYDSGKAPAGEDGAPELRPVDLEAVNALLDQAAADIKANDPRQLRAEVARLQRELAQASKVTAPGQGPEVGKLLVERDKTIKLQRDKIVELQDEVEQLRWSNADCVRRFNEIAALAKVSFVKSRAKAGVEVAAVEKAAAEPVSRPAGGRSPVSGRGPGGAAADPEGSTLTGPQRHLLEALAWWAAMGHAEPTRTQLAAKAGWTPRGSNLRNRLSELSQAGLVEYPRTGTVRFTPAGVAAAPEPDTAATLIESIRTALTAPQRGILDVLLANRDRSLTRADLAGLVGWEPGGSNLRNRLSELRQLELVEYPTRGEVALQEWVQ